MMMIQENDDEDEEGDLVFGITTFPRRKRLIMAHLTKKTLTSTTLRRRRAVIERGHEGDICIQGEGSQASLRA